jgi:hypothetical protein
MAKMSDLQHENWQTYYSWPATGSNYYYNYYSLASTASPARRRRPSLPDLNLRL